MGPVDWGDIALSALSGGIAGPLIAALAVLLWHRLRAPAKVWAANQKAVADLTATTEQLGGEVARQKGALAERDAEVDHLRETNNQLSSEYRRVQAQLDARRQLELIPRASDGITILPVQIEYGDSRENLEAAVVWATLSFTLINHDDHPTTIQRLWLRVCDPITGEEILPLPNRDLGMPAAEGIMPPEESFRHPDRGIGARDQQERELRFRQYYPRTVVDMAREGKAQLMVSLCVKAAGLSMACCPLTEEFFASSAMRSEDL